MRGHRGTDVKGRKRPWLSTLLVVSLVVGLGAVGGWAFPHHHKAKAPLYPMVWDLRVAPLAEAAAKFRGLTFVHPIYVDFLTSDAFEKVFAGLEQTSEVAARQTQRADTLRSIGLMTDSDQLEPFSAKAKSAGVLAFYSFKTKRAYVRGTELTPDIQVTLVHELTHALQDQHFNIAQVSAEVIKNPDQSSLAYSALYEGDATRVEFAYQDSLPADVQKQIEAARKTQLTQAENDSVDGPEYLAASSDAPYELGLYAVDRAFRAGGNAKVDELFTQPPPQALQMMDPWLMPTPWALPAVATPDLGAGNKKVGVGQLGAFTLYLMLAERLPYPQALTAAEQWGNDSLLVYQAPSGVCIRDAMVAKSEPGANVLASALQQWAGGAPGGATVTNSAGTMTIAICDPGSLGYGLAEHSFDAYLVLAHRNSLEAAVEKGGQPFSNSLCYANAVVNHFDTATLFRFEDNKISDDENRQLRQLATSCRG